MLGSYLFQGTITLILTHVVKITDSDLSPKEGFNCNSLFI